MIPTPTPNAAADAPGWLQGAVQLVTQPPGWLPPLLYLAVAGVAVTAIHRAHTRGVPREARGPMIANAWALACCGGVTWAVVGVGALSYLGNVLVGAGLGVGLWWLSLPSVDDAVEEAVANYHKAESPSD